MSSRVASGQLGAIAIMGWAEEHFESDYHNLAEMFSHNSVLQLALSQETSPHLFAFGFLPSSLPSLSLSMALGDTLERPPKVARYKRIPKERSETWKQAWDSRWNVFASADRSKRKQCKWIKCKTGL